VRAHSLPPPVNCCPTPVECHTQFSNSLVRTRVEELEATIAALEARMAEEVQRSRAAEEERDRAELQRQTLAFALRVLTSPPPPPPVCSRELVETQSRIQTLTHQLDRLRSPSAARDGTQASLEVTPPPTFELTGAGPAAKFDGSI
jgi:hypothetical protein